MTNCETVKISSQTLKSYLRNTIYIFLQQNDIPKICIFSSFSQSRKGDLKIIMADIQICDSFLWIFFSDRPRQYPPTKRAQPTGFPKSRSFFQELDKRSSFQSCSLHGRNQCVSLHSYSCDSEISIKKIQKILKVRTMKNQCEKSGPMGCWDPDLPPATGRPTRPRQHWRKPSEPVSHLYTYMYQNIHICIKMYISISAYLISFMFLDQSFIQTFPSKLIKSWNKSLLGTHLSISICNI